MPGPEDFISDILSSKTPTDPVPLVKRMLTDVPHAPRRTTPAPTPLPPLPRFEDVDVQLDPNMPSAQRDQIRQAWFVKNILPRIQPGFSIQGTFDDFMRRTERPKIFGTAGRTLIRAGLLATQATKAMIPGVDLGANEKLLRQIADREGIGTTAPELVGQLAGMGISLEMLGAATKALQGPAAAQLAKQFMMGQKKAQFVANVARGGFTLGAYDALMAKEGDRVNAGLRGAAFGTAWELGIGAFTKFGESELRASSKSDIVDKLGSTDEDWDIALGGKRGMTEPEIREAETRIRDRAEWERATNQMTPPPVGARTDITIPRPPTEPVAPATAPPPVSQTDWDAALGVKPGFSEEQVRAAEQKIQDRAEWDRSMRQMTPPSVGAGSLAGAITLDAMVKDAAKKGFTTGPPQFSGGTKGIFVHGVNVDGSPFRFIVKKGEEEEAYGQLESILDQGGRWNGTDAYSSPQSQSRVTELYRHFAERAEEEEQTWRMRIDKPSKRNATAAMKQMNRMGLRATILNEGEILIGPKAPWRLAQEARARVKQGLEFAAKGGPAIEVKDLTAESDIANHRDMFEAGRLRQLKDLPIPERGYDREFPGAQPGRRHNRRIDELTRDIAFRHGIGSRYDVGKLALRYYQDTVAGIRTKGATQILEDYKALAEKKGIPPLAEKARPAREETGILEGYRSGSPNAELAWSPTDQELRSAPGTMRERPGGRTKILEAPRERGLFGAVIPGEAGEDPIRVLTKDATRADITEESLHYGHVVNGVPHDALEISARSRKTATDIIGGIQKESPHLYSKLPGRQLLDEAFAKASTAVRLNDTARLDELARMDTSVAHVRDFVRENAREMLKNITDDTVAHRQYARRLRDLVRRTDPAISESLDQAAGQFGYQTWFDPELGKWVMRDGEGREIWHNALNDVWDHFHNADPSVMFPDQAHSWFLQGMRSGEGFVGEGNTPNFTVSGTPEIAPRILMGFQAVAQWFRPALDSFSGIQKKLDKLGLEIPLYNTAHRLWEGAQKAGAVRDQIAMDLDKVMKGVPRARWKDYGEVLSRPESYWPTHASKLNLDASDLDRMSKIKEWDRVHHTAGKVGLADTLQKLWEYRSVGNDLERVNWTGPVYDALKRNHLGQDFNLGTVAQWIQRQNYESALGDELKAWGDVRKQFKRTPELQSTMDNYRDFILNHSDTSQKLLNNFGESWQASANKYIQSMNRALPKGAQIPQFQLGSAWPTMRAVMYTAGLAGRASVAIRDTFQSTYGMVAIGPAAFAKGIAMSFTPEGRRLASEAGALLHPRNVRQFFGDVMSDLPTGGRIQSNVNWLTDKLLSPSRLGHNVGRRAVFLGEYDQALREITRFREGGMTNPIQLAKRTSAWFHDAPEKSRLLALAADPAVKVEEAAKQFALSANLATQFGGPPGSALRTGLGKMLGQYANWPLNHLEFTAKLAVRALDTPSKGIPALGMWAAMNYGAYEGGKAVGIDVGKWVGFSPAGYEGSPSMELVQHLLEAPAEDDKGRQARKAILEFPLTEFTPGAVQFENLYKAYRAGELNDPATILGFKKWKDPAEELDLYEQLRKEAGFSPRPRPE